MPRKIERNDGPMSKVAVSFSGGKSSAVMTDILWQQRNMVEDLKVCFVNVGCEHPATLDFVRDCQMRRGWEVDWIEPVINPEIGKGVRYKLVNYETASRNGEPFEDYIAKHGIPGPAAPGCTNYLKEQCMNAYRKFHLGWRKRDYWTAIGIRADEIDRMSPYAQRRRLFYPLVQAGHTKKSVEERVTEWGITLNLPSDAWGNCVWCWKKSLRKLLTVAQKDPSAFDFPLRMEAKYKRNRQEDGQEDRLFFRNHMRTADLLALAKDNLRLQQMNFIPYSDDGQRTIFSEIGWDSILDEGGGCGDSCEIGADYHGKIEYGGNSNAPQG